MPRAYIMFIFSIAPQLTTGTNTICASQSNIEITGSNPDQTSTKQLNIRNVKGMVSRDFVLQFFWLNTFYLGPV